MFLLCFVSMKNGNHSPISYCIKLQRISWSGNLCFGMRIKILVGIMKAREPFTIIHHMTMVLVVIHISSCQEPICGQVWKSPSTHKRLLQKKSVNFGDKLASAAGEFTFLIAITIGHTHTICYKVLYTLYTKTTLLTMIMAFIFKI